MPGVINSFISVPGLASEDDFRSGVQRSVGGVDDVPSLQTKPLMVPIIKLSHAVVRMVWRECSDKTVFSFKFAKKTSLLFGAHLNVY